MFTPVVSRFSFVWLTHRQTLADVICGFEAAWAFLDGVFATVIPDNMKTIVVQADPLQPRLNQGFVEYAQDRGFWSISLRCGPRKTSRVWSGWCRSCVSRSSPVRRPSISRTRKPANIANSAVISSLTAMRRA